MKCLFIKFVENKKLKMKLNQAAAYYRKRSQLIVLTGILLGGGISLLPLTANAVVDQAAVLKKVVESGNTDGLTEEEKTWFTSFFSGTTLHSGSEGIKIGCMAIVV